MPLLLLLCMELFLRLAGFGYSTAFFKLRIVAGCPSWIDNRQFGRRFFPPGLVRRPRPFAIPVVKPEKTIRIFVLGSSAAMGDPDFKFGLPRMLQVLLRERFPDRHFEVVNAAMVAINSNVVLPIARDCAQRDGDLWVIYMGNNEMVGPFGSLTVFGARAPPLGLVRMSLKIKSMRVGQLLDSAINSLSHRGQSLPQWKGMEMMAGLKLRHDAPATTRVYSTFEQNLKEILKTGCQASVPILLCTVATNIKDCAPFASLHSRLLSKSDLLQWNAAYDTGVELQKAGKVLEAEVAFEQAARLDHEFAELSFRQAQCCSLLGREAEAARLFRQARDDDALQFRADTRINNIIRGAATTFKEQHVKLLDAETLFATNSPHGLTGSGFFYEHVHLRPEGNYLLARAVAEQVAATLSLETTKPWLSEQECLSQLGLTDWNRYDDLNVILDRIQHPPFPQQCDHQSQLRLIEEQLDRYKIATKPAELRREVRQVSALVERYPADTDLRCNLAALLQNQGDNDAALAQWRALIRLQPQSALPEFNLARLLERLGRHAEAQEAFQKALQIDPEDSSIQQGLADDPGAGSESGMQ